MNHRRGHLWQRNPGGVWTKREGCGKHGCSCEKGEIYQAATFCTHTKSWSLKAVQLQYSFQLGRKDSFCDRMDEEIPHGKSNPQGEATTSWYEYISKT